jgi:D-arabinan exo alpha-(1,3)/(1,5)-arabinofuranosidase (non-reducing end)
MRLLIFMVFSAGFLVWQCRRDEMPVSKSSAVPEHSVASELKVLYDVSYLPAYLDSTVSAQVSSYDTTGGNDDGFSGHFSYLRKNKDGSLVLFDIWGGGVINRIWTPTPTADTLDFFIDDTLKPAFSAAYKDLFSGNKYPFTEPLCGNQLGGYYCYMPIPFEKNCRIISRGRKEQFHQIQYRMYEKNARIKAFSLQPDTEEKEALDKIRSLWAKEKKSASDFYSGTMSVSSGEFILKPGEPVSIFKTNRGGRICGIELSPASLFEGLAKYTDIKITWDDEPTAAVYCPVADFFGYAFGSPSMQSLLLGTKNNKAYCYFPMPFDKSARIELIQRNSDAGSKKPLHVRAEIWFTPDKRMPLNEGKFYAHWERRMKLQPSVPHLFADIRGKGHYVGTLLQAQGLNAGMTIFFEGDDSTSIDNCFRLHGTGSEDYFNGGWYAMMDRWDDKMSLPLHGSLGYSLPFCRTGGYRLYLSDKLSFEKSFWHSIEHGPAGNNIPADYTSLGLYYCDTPPQDITVPTGEITKVFIPDTMFIYPQLMDLTLYGKMNIETTWKYGTGGESYLFAPGQDTWLRISLKEIPKDKYSVAFDIIKSPSGCEFSLWQRQKQVSGWISSYNDSEIRIKDLHICDIAVTESCETLTIRFRSEQQKNSLILNRIRLIRK